MLPPKLREGAELREPPKLLVDGVGLLYEWRGVELPKLRLLLLLLLFGVKVFRGVVALVELLEKERCVLGRVAVERVLLCLPLPKVRVRFCVVPFPKERVPLRCCVLVRVSFPKERVPLFCCV